MKLVRIRTTEQVITINEEEWPVKYHFQLPALHFSIEVRLNDKQQAAYVSGEVVQDQITRYAGRGVLRSFSEFGLYKALTGELFSIAESLGVGAQHIWPFVEEFPAFSESGVKIADAQTFEVPIRDLLARGAAPLEVVCSLGISHDLFEFVAGEPISEDAAEDRNLAAYEGEVW